MSSYVVVVMNANGVAATPLPPAGEVTLGRGEDCEVRIDDEKLSRRHAVVRRAGNHVEIIDLGSMNGTVLGERRLTPNVAVDLPIGVMVTMGSSAVSVNRDAAPEARPGHVLSQRAFHARLEEERARSRRERTRFAIVRVRFEMTAPSVEAVTATVRADDLAIEARRIDLVDRAIKQILRERDVLASNGLGGYEILFVDASLDDAHERVRALDAPARSLGMPFEVQAEAFPEAREAPSSSKPAAGAMGRLAPIIERLASSQINVLILGETGVGKEVMARAIHDKSARAKAPLVSINCAAFSEALLESELFGHERGAFTGAVQAKEGLLESAQGGTVFLDEVGEMPLTLQAKLLRVLEQREVMRVGALKPRSIDARFLSATNRDLEKEIEAGRFRRDLFFRLNAVAIQIPPLRERVDEIEPLARMFAGRAAEPLGHAAPELSPEVIGFLAKHAWPGNIRELKNVIDRAVLFAGQETVRLEHLPLDQMTRRDTMPSQASSTSPDDERSRIIAALERCAGNQTQAAKLLGMPRRTFVQRLDDYAIARPRKREDEP